MNPRVQGGESCKGESTSQVLLTGVIGLVGGYSLWLLQNEPNINTVVASTRHPLMPAEGAFNPYGSQLTDALAQVVDPVDIVFCCLGTMRRETGSKEVFVHAGYTLVIDTALAGKRLSAQHMLAASAMGVSVHSPFLYNRVEGEMEAALIGQTWPQLTIAQPSMLSGEREKKRANETPLEPLFRLLPGNWKAIPARDVAIALLVEVLSPSQEGAQILTSSQLQGCTTQQAKQRFTNANIRRTIHDFNSYPHFLLGNAMTGQSSSQAASPLQWWKPVLFFLVVIVGLWLVKRQPYYGKAFIAMEIHSIGKSIPVQADASPLKAAWDYAMIYFLAVQKAAVPSILPGSLIQVLILRSQLSHTLGQSRFQGTLLGVIFSPPGMICTYCAAPVAAGMCKQQVSVGGALAFWIGNPLLSPATLVFMGFALGQQLTLARLVASLAAALIIATLVQKRMKEVATQSVAVPAAPSEAVRDSFFNRQLRALWTLFWSTIPIYVLAALVLGVARVWLFPHADGTVDNTLLWVITMVIAGCLFVILTAAETPIVQTMMLAGAGTASALTLLITPPAVNVPPLITLRKTFPTKALWLTDGLAAPYGAIVGVLALIQPVVNV